MKKMLDSVDQRTKLVGENRLELLLFKISATQLFAINVFKVKEVVKLPPLSALPGSNPNISGVANIRGMSIPVINLRGAIGFSPMPVSDDCNLIITEYNRSVQGFLVGKVEHIVNMTWGDIMPPPKSAGANNYLTAITKLQDNDVQRLVSIIDVEKVLAEIIDYDITLSEGVLDQQLVAHMPGRKVLIVDDSATARKQVRDTLSQLGIKIIEASDGLQALNMLKGWAAEGKSVADELLMMITDAEMPEMDGYKLTAEVRADERMASLYITLNTSLSGSFNNAMVEKVGCDKFISKFQPDLLVDAVQQRLKMILD
ncbi:MULTISPECIES: chemotaxis protein CheV [unclassified Shewanella]|uniref:chemotaxis protein CheV n=1 Tax=unclassified Shewanella TaxID=196818 RepID=UPI000C8335EE|nr:MULTISPECIES: chemotaxis protein CheV [unclassified Shewanella]MDO6618845.1 chemotaxis protein CheV [Shewanella sp. 6_MG-2023]MDO6640398.1 chemotaxis protein CheV [Shewanella sp. 5_MG-2023]MDO6677860.1 chemotaxis protein CheV [Shewanella sp. 4_MG-2023]PMG51250.1 chemotaxis protein CheW [Shewanella sp. 10N.286.52.B9]PMH87021.1 chemotaxis protein CheW [Shewanella sp. 10N.286.48.B5]